MRTCQYAGAPFTEPRSHPWQGSATASTARYVDFTRHPELIRSELEDFRPWEGYAAVETFYGLLERLNRLGSALESNDCAFNGPAASESESVQGPMECSGRLMLLLRKLGDNLVPGRIQELEGRLHHELFPIDPTFVQGMIGSTVMPTRFLALGGGDEQQLGSQLMISFWTWGESEAETMANLDRLLTNLSVALGRLD